MASISFDPGNGWWSIRYFAGPSVGRIKKNLCKHPGTWSTSRPPKRAPGNVLALAQQYLEAERRAKLGMETVVPSRTPLRGYMGEYRDRITMSLAVNTMEAIANACEKFAVYCEGRDVTSVQGVNYAVCRDWIASRLKEGAQRSTVVTERSNLRPIWTQAVMERIVTENPWASAVVPGKRRTEIPTAWTREEVGKLAASTDGWLRDLILLGVNTGIRISALLGLRWSQIDWPAELIRVRAASSKSGRPYDVPITPTTHDVLSARLAASADDTYVFQHRILGKVPYSARTTFTRIERAVHRAKISDYGDYNHVMRRTFATLALNSGVPLEVVSRCLDHATLAQTQRAYAHLLVARLKEGMAGFDVGPGT